MGKRRCIDRLMLLVTFIASIIFYSCKDDVFNAEKVKATYQDKFPVKDIDPQMDWKMTKQVTVSVSVYEDAGVDYTIRIYDADPLNANTDAHLLTEGTANNTLAFTTTMDCPNVLSDVYVCREDPEGRNIMKPASIENGKINVSFGIIPASTRVNTRSTISIETYSPKKSETEIKAMLANAIEITANNKLQSGKVYRISKDREYQGKLNNEGIWDGLPPATVIIEGTWAPNGNNMDLGNGTDIYVLDGGTITIPKKKTMEYNSNDGYLAIFKGGTLEGEDNSSQLKLSHIEESAHHYHYNAGTIKNIGLIDIPEHGNMTFYNCGTMENIVTMTCGRFINHGTAILGSMTGHNGDCKLENACQMQVGTFNGNLILASSTYTQLTNYNQERGSWSATATLDDNAMLVIENASLTARTFNGPTSTNYSLVKINTVTDLEQGFSSSGNIYYEIKNPLPKHEEWQQKFFNQLKNTNGTVSKWGESPFVLTPGDCAGTGNTPGEGTGTPTNPIRYTYVFEDNFPLVGDYDFNDIVLDVAITYIRKDDSNNLNNKIKKMRLDITLAAAGASKTLGAGLRLVGISKDIVDDIETGGADARFENTLGDKNLFFKNIDDHIEQGDKDIVIPLFGNAHQVFDNVNSGKIINTDPSGLKSKAYTYEVIIEFEDEYRTVNPQITKDNLDFFICYKYKTMEKRVEVHLYEFWKYGATAVGTIQQENLDLAGNNTWAICVPNFRYPKEYINISNQKDNSDCAYPEFLNWARNRNTYQDWYLHPNEENVYR